MARVNKGLFIGDYGISPEKDVYFSDINYKTKKIFFIIVFFG